MGTIPIRCWARRTKTCARASHTRDWLKVSIQFAHAFEPSAVTRVAGSLQLSQSVPMGRAPTAVTQRGHTIVHRPMAAHCAMPASSAAPPQQSQRTKESVERAPRHGAHRLCPSAPGMPAWPQRTPSRRARQTPAVSRRRPANRTPVPEPRSVLHDHHRSNVCHDRAAVWSKSVWNWVSGSWTPPEAATTEPPAACLRVQHVKRPAACRSSSNRALASACRCWSRRAAR
jgi:hypothetical protein